jgi:hypothetical protein
VPLLRAIVPRQRAFAADMAVINDCLDGLIAQARAAAVALSEEDLQARDYSQVRACVCSCVCVCVCMRGVRGCECACSMQPALPQVCRGTQHTATHTDTNTRPRTVLKHTNTPTLQHINTPTHTRTRTHMQISDPSLLRFLVDVRGADPDDKQLRDDLMTMLIAGARACACACACACTCTCTCVCMCVRCKCMRAGCLRS